MMAGERVDGISFSSAVHGSDYLGKCIDFVVANNFAGLQHNKNSNDCSIVASGRFLAYVENIDVHLIVSHTEMSLVQHAQGSALMYFSCYNLETVTEGNILTIQSCYEMAIWYKKNAFEYDMSTNECRIMDCPDTVTMLELSCLTQNCPDYISVEMSSHYNHRSIVSYL
eukprot:Awhi_evm2s5527